MILRLWRGVGSLQICWNAVGATRLELKGAGQLDVALVPVLGNGGEDEGDYDEGDDEHDGDDDDDDGRACPQEGGSAGECESRDRKHGLLAQSPSQEQPSLTDYDDDDGGDDNDHDEEWYRQKPKDPLWTFRCPTGKCWGRERQGAMLR